MASNPNSSGCVLELAVPTGGCTAGLVYLFGGVVGVATVTKTAAEATAGDRANFIVEGLHSLPRATGTAWTEGQPAYWDATNAKVSTDPTVGLPIGAVAAAAASADTTGSVRLNESANTGRVLNVRKRCTVAQVNAGVTLIPAVPGAKLRMIDAKAIAVGGAAGAVTTVDILGTLTTSRKLVAFAQASLTQSTVLRDGAAGAAVLADGASYTPNDAGTAITAGKTGADITTATHIDFILTVSLE